jgi:hypothetical protein
VQPAADPSTRPPAQVVTTTVEAPPTTRPVAPAEPVNRGTDGSSCYADAISGGLVLQNQNAGGPVFTSTACRSIHLKLTQATYRTYARSCLETPDGGTTGCSGWVYLSYPDTWDTLSTNVPDGPIAPAVEERSISELADPRDRSCR